MQKQKNLNKVKIYETMLTLTTAGVFFGWLFKANWLLIIAVILGITGLLIKPLAQLISRFWLQFSEILGLFSSKIILGLIFFLFLTPVSIVYRLFNKDKLILKNTKKSTFVMINHKYTREDLEKTW